MTSSKTSLFAENV